MASSDEHEDAMRSIPPPPVAATDEAEVREPSMHLVLPVAQAATECAKRAVGGSFQSAIVMIVIDRSREKARFYVQLALISAFGELEAPDTSRELFDTAGALIAEDALSGNGPWRKLVIRFSPQGYGTAVGKVDVS